MIDEMYKDMSCQLEAEYSKAQAEDKGTFFIIELFKRVREDWYKRWADMEREVAPQLGKKADARTRRLIQRKMREYGLTVKKELTEAQHEAVKEIVRQDIEHSKTIPMGIAEEVQTTVARCYESGRDWHYLTREMERLKGVAMEKAKLEARDRMNRVTQGAAVANAKELGATRGRWIHVPGYHSARISHLAMDGKLFDLSVGMYDSYAKRYVKPGELRYCNCTFEPIFPGFED